MRAVIYARYSSENQREESAEAQIRACTEYAESKSYDIVGTYVDKEVSGKGAKVKKRLEFQRMIKDSEKKLFEVVLVHKYNRFARNERDHVNYEAALNDNGVILVSTKENFGQGKEALIVKALLRALSQFYIEDLADEVRKGHKENAYKAMHNGGYAPFGYDIVDQQFVINNFEAAFVTKMFDCAVNRKGFKDLIEEMERAGVRGKRGKFLRYPSIYEILRNERYTGTYVYDVKSEKHDRRAKKNAIRIDNAIPQIISREIWEEVQKIMDERKQTGRNSEYPLRGLVYCKNCGAKMVGHIATKNGIEYRHFECSKRCGVGSIRMEDVEARAREYITALLSENNMVTIYQAIDKYSKEENTRINDFNAAIKAEVEKKQKQIDNYMDKLGMELPADVIKDIGEKISTLKKEVAALEQQTPPKDFTDKQILNWLEHIKAAPDEKVLRLLISKAYANKEGTSFESMLVPQILGGDTQI